MTSEQSGNHRHTKIYYACQKSDNTIPILSINTDRKEPLYLGGINVLSLLEVARHEFSPQIETAVSFLKQYHLDTWHSSKAWVTHS